MAKSAASHAETLAYTMDKIAETEGCACMAVSFDGTIVLIATGRTAQVLEEAAEDTGLVEFQQRRRKARSPRARKPAPAEDGESHRNEVGQSAP